MIRFPRFSVPMIALAVCLGATPALAQKNKPAPSPLLDSVSECRAIADSAARLVCFDKASERLSGAAASGEVAVIDRSELRKTRRSLFGFGLPSLPFFKGDTSGEADSDTLETTITEAISNPRNPRVLIKLAEGNAQWEITEPYINWDEPRRGSKVVIKRGPMGSYFLRVDGQRGVRGRRVN